MEQKKRKKKKKKAPRKWDDSRSNLNSHKLKPSKQLEKKLNSVSKHRHYAKDLIQEQKKKHYEQRRLKQEEKEIELEQKQLIRRKQLLMRKHPIPNLKRTFPQFTAGRSDYNDYSSTDDDDDDSVNVFQSDESENDDYDNTNVDSNKTEMTLHALSHKLSSLENELETMKLTNHVNDDETIKDSKNVENINEINVNDTGNITLDINSINETLNAANVKKATKTVHLKLPTMPSVTTVTQPPQLTEERDCDRNYVKKPNDEEKTINKSLHSLDVPSLLMLLDKLKIYFKEIQTEKKQNEEFRSTLLESVNAQNTQILHLLAQSASQQKEMDNLKSTVALLTDKLDKFEASNMNTVINKNSEFEAKWTNCISNRNMSNDIALKDIKNVIEEARPNAYKTQTMLKNTDWKSISNVLIPKDDLVEYNPELQQTYSVQKHQRSFLPTHSVQSQEQTQRSVPPPQPIPKPSKNKNQNFIGMEQNILNNNLVNYPKIRVERYHK